MARFRLTFVVEVEADNRAEAEEIGSAIMDGGVASEGVPGSPQYELRITRARA